MSKKQNNFVPLSLEQTLQWMFNEYPRLFQVRWQALGYLFFSTTPDFDWENGSLMSLKEKEVCSLTLGEDGKAVQRNVIEGQIPVGMKFPLRENEFSPIQNLPADIQPDWLAGVNEVRQLVEHQDTFEDAGATRDWYDIHQGAREIGRKLDENPELKAKLRAIWNSNSSVEP